MPEWTDVLAAITSVRPDDPVGSRHRLREVWAALGGDQATGPGFSPRADALAAKRCVIAHYAADLEPDLADEVRWDEAALTAYADVAEDDLAPVGIPSARGLAPSLYLNLADGYLRQGHLAESRRHLAAAQAALPDLADDDYSQVIRGAIDGVSARLAAAQD